jgi:hypothetical protein
MMVSERIKKDLIALSVSIVVNCIITIPTAAIPDWGIEVVGLFVAPIFGGIFRSIVAHKRDLFFIIPGMFILDCFVFVPLITFLNIWGENYLMGLLFGAIAGSIMVLSSIVGLAIRYLIENRQIYIKKS